MAKKKKDKPTPVQGADYKLAAGLMQNAPWWTEEPKKVARRLMTLVRSQYRNQGMRYQSMRRYGSVYEYGYRASERITSREKAIDETTLYFNPSQNIVDTVVAQVTMPKLLTYALPQGDAGFLLRRKAMDMNRGVAAERDRLEMDRHEEDAVRSFALQAGGFIKVTDTPWGEVVAENCSPLDMLFDEAESYYGTPRCWYHRYRMDRYVALEMWGREYDGAIGTPEERRERIMRCSRAIIDNDDFLPSDDIIEVIEAYRLPSRDWDEDDSNLSECDGRYAVCIEGQTLCYQPYYYATPDIAHYIPRRSRAGVWGIPIMRQLVAGQREFEYTTSKLQRSHRRTGSANIIARRDSNIAIRHLTNDQGAIVEYDTTPPQEWNPNAASSQMYQYRDMIPTDMMRFVGSSEYSAQSQVPSGLYQASGKALMLFEDAENKRFIEWHRERERLALRTSKLILRAIKRILARGSEYKSRYIHDKKAYFDIDWSKVVDEVGECEIRVFPVGALSQNPAARFKELDALMNRGAISLPQFKKLFPLPTIDDELSLDISERDVVEWAMDKIAYEGEMVHVESFDNPGLCIEIAGKFYNKVRKLGLPEDRLEMIRNYILEAETKANDLAAGAPPMPGGPMPDPSSAATPMPPMGGPMAPPGADPMAALAPILGALQGGGMNGAGGMPPMNGGPPPMG